MPVASPTTASSEAEPKSPGGGYLPSSPGATSHGEREGVRHPERRSTFARLFTSLQEHADAMSAMAVLPEGDTIHTPQHEGRRESFAWDIATDHTSPTTKSRSSRRSRHETTPALPSGETTHSSIPEDDPQIRKASDTSSCTGGSQPSSARLSAGSTFADSLYRSDTGRSSLTSFVRGMIRHGPDMRMFSPTDKTSQNKDSAPSASNTPGASRRGSKHIRKLSSSAPTKPIKNNQDDNSTRPGPLPKDFKTQMPTPRATKGGLKDRRKLDHTESLKLVIPPELSNLPTRQRFPAVSPAPAADPRSPQTPWARSKAVSWQPMVSSEPSTSVKGSDKTGHGVLPGSDPIISSQDSQPERPSPRTRDRYYITRPRFRRHRSGTSESTLSQTPEGNYTTDEMQVLQEHQARTKEELKELGQQSRQSRSRRWRVTGPWTSTDLPSTDSPTQELDASDSRFLTNMFKKPKRSVRIDNMTVNKLESPSSHFWGRKRPISSPPTFEDTLANMPVPPAFVPPGLSRVPTPPMFNTHAELKGKLAGFFFDTQGVPSRRPKASPGRIWDSDALLMSLQNDISPDTDSSEGPEGPSSSAPTQLELEQRLDIVSPLAAIRDGYITNNTSNSQSQTTPDSEDWYRAKHVEKSGDQDLTAAMLRQADEKAKFEWMVPEHLPNSPLCPLHEKYRGPSHGTCYWHSRKKSSTGGNHFGGKANGKRRSSNIGDGTDDDDEDGVGGRYGWERDMFDGLRVWGPNVQAFSKKMEASRRLTG